MTATEKMAVDYHENSNHRDIQPKRFACNARSFSKATTILQIGTMPG